MPHLTRDELSWRRALRRQTDRHESSHVLRTVVAPAVLAVAVIVAIVFAVTGGDGSGSASVGPVASPVPPSGITAAATAPQRVVMARSGRLEVVLPVAEQQVTAVYFRAAGDPGGIAMTPASGLPHAVTQEESTSGAGLSAVDVGAPAGSVVYSPVDGVVTAVSPYRVLGSPEGLSIVLTPSGMPDVAVNVTHVEPGPDGAVPRVGTAVGAGRTVLGRVRDMSRVETPAITRYTNDAGNHVTVELLRQTTGPGA
jgi:hypothetical protein